MIKRIFKIFVVLFIVVFAKTSNAQLPIRSITTNLYISPFITLGYTFGSGLCYGIDLTFGLITIKHYNPEITGALSLQYYLVNYNKSQHIIKNVTFVAESKYFRIGAGAGEIKKSWGFMNRNTSKAFGTNIDFGLSAFNSKVPWVALKAFIPKEGTWEWCDNKNYISAYTYFKAEPFFLFQQ